MKKKEIDLINNIKDILIEKEKTNKSKENSTRLNNIKVKEKKNQNCEELKEEKNINKEYLLTNKNIEANNINDEEKIIENHHTKEEKLENNNGTLIKYNENKIVEHKNEQNITNIKDKLSEKKNNIIKKFYKEKICHFKEKLRLYYKNLFNYKSKYINPKNLENSSDVLEYNTLSTLRNYIFEKAKFSLNGLSECIQDFPLKYINIVILLFNNIDTFVLNRGLLYAKFKMEFTNNAIRIAINEIMNEIEENFQQRDMSHLNGAAEGWFLENRIDYCFRQGFKVFNENNIQIRNLFSLVGITTNSEATIKKHREDEKTLNYLLKGKNNYDIIIDDIDNIKKINYYDLNGDCYYIRQISLNGRTSKILLYVISPLNRLVLIAPAPVIETSASPKYLKVYILKKLIM